MDINESRDSLRLLQRIGESGFHICSPILTSNIIKSSTFSYLRSPPWQVRIWSSKWLIFIFNFFGFGFARKASTENCTLIGGFWQGLSKFSRASVHLKLLNPEPWPVPWISVLTVIFWNPVQFNFPALSDSSLGFCQCLLRHCLKLYQIFKLFYGNAEPTIQAKTGLQSVFGFWKIWMTEILFEPVFSLIQFLKYLYSITSAYKKAQKTVPPSFKIPLFVTPKFSPCFGVPVFAKHLAKSFVSNLFSIIFHFNKFLRCASKRLLHFFLLYFNLLNFCSRTSTPEGELPFWRIKNKRAAVEAFLFIFTFLLCFFVLDVKLSKTVLPENCRPVFWLLTAELIRHPHSDFTVLQLQFF